MTETYILWILDKHLKFRAKDILWNKVMKLAGHLVHQVGWWHWSRAISMDWISRQTLFRCKHCWTISLPRVDLLPDHDDDMTWKSFPHYCHLCGESTVDQWIPLTKGQWYGAFVCSLLNAKQDVKQTLSCCQWIDKPWCSCDITVMTATQHCIPWNICKFLFFFFIVVILTIT